jgi:hypothetical protein
MVRGVGLESGSPHDSDPIKRVRVVVKGISFCNKGIKSCNKGINQIPATLISLIPFNPVKTKLRCNTTPGTYCQSEPKDATQTPDSNTAPVVRRTVEAARVLG